MVELEVAVEERLALSEFKVEGWRRPVTPRVDFFAGVVVEEMEEEMEEEPKDDDELECERSSRIKQQRRVCPGDRTQGPDAVVRTPAHIGDALPHTGPAYRRRSRNSGRT